MTNHPRRQRDDENDPAIRELEDFAEAAEEAAAEISGTVAHLRSATPDDIPPQGSAEVPAHNGNGVPPGLRGGAAKVAAEAVAEALGQHLPQMLFQAVAAALQQVPVQTVSQQHLCATCLLQRITWEQAHQADMEKAMADAAAAAGVAAGSPQAAQLDLAAFLPPGLRPGERGGMPNVGQAATTVGGAEVCPMHIPGVQGASPRIQAYPAMGPAMLGQLAGIR